MGGITVAGGEASGDRDDDDDKNMNKNKDSGPKDKPPKKETIIYEEQKNVQIITSTETKT